MVTFALVGGLLSAFAPAAIAAETLTLTTPYPGVEVSPDSRVTFNLEVQTSVAARVELSLSGVPATWNAALRGGGFTITAVQTDGKEATEVRLDVDIPGDAAGGSATIIVKASGAGQAVELPLSVTVKADAGGEITIQPDFPGQTGSTDQTFTFSLNISNETAEDLTYTATGQGPVGWSVEAKPTGSSTASSGIVKAGGTAGISVSVKPTADAPADTYKVTVVATVGTKQIQQELDVVITGSYSLDLKTENEVLTSRGGAGAVTEQAFEITNTGTAPVTNVKMTSSNPSNWKVDFDKPEIASIAPSETVKVIAKITPTGDAIAGDYEITFRATGTEARDTAEMRFTVETSILGAIIGLALIILAVGGLWFVFQRYGRR